MNSVNPTAFYVHPLNFSSKIETVTMEISIPKNFQIKLRGKLVDNHKDTEFTFRVKREICDKLYAQESILLQKKLQSVYHKV